MRFGTLAFALVTSLLLPLVVVACGARHAALGTQHESHVGFTATTASTVDAGALRACVHDAKDLSPCHEDCDRGIASACALIAERAPNPTAGVLAHERACELQVAQSCVSAARMHASGTGVPPNRVKQITLLDKACRFGDAFACSVPAKAYATGNGVPQDERRAHELWQKACAGGVEQACEAIGETSP